MPIKPPKISKCLLRLFIEYTDHDSLIGDFDEMFEILCQERGRFRASLWYWSQIFKAIPSFIRYHIFWGVYMFTNYLKVALRNLKKQKIYSFINISGLALGLAIYTLFSFLSGISFKADKFHEKGRRIFGVVQVIPEGNQDEDHTAYTSASLMPVLLEECPEIEEGVRIIPADRMIVNRQESRFSEDGIQIVDPGFLSIFSFELVAGDPSKALSEPFSIILSETKAIKYFGNENPLGNFLTLNNQIDVTVTGIIDHKPIMSSIPFDFLVSMGTARALGIELDDWESNPGMTFLLLPEDYDPGLLEEKLPAVGKKYIAESPESPDRMYLFPLHDFRMGSNDIDSFMLTTMPGDVYTFFFIGVLILLVVCINFINLSTARYSERMKEVGVRKVIGAQRIQLIKQFMSESLLFAIIALPLSLILYQVIWPSVFAHFGYAGDEGNLLSIWRYPFLKMSLVSVTIFVGIFSGLYPALFLSAFRPVQVLKGGALSGRKGSRVRTFLVMLQFVLSIVFIVMTMVLNKQFDHIMHADFGYSRDRILVVPVSGDARNNMEIMKEDLKKYSDILMVSASQNLPGSWIAERRVRLEGRDESEVWDIDVYGIDHDFIEMLEIPIVRGKSFSQAFSKSPRYIVNETAVRRLQWEDPIGRQLTIGNETGLIVGVTHDFLFRYAGYNISPAVFSLENEVLNYMLIKVSSPDKMTEVQAFVEERWHVLHPDLPFDCFPLNNHFSEIYKALNIIAQITRTIGGIAVLFSCLGLLGLASYVVRKKTKEIGVRKVLGASVKRIVSMLVKKFVLLVVISNIIALPIAFLLSRALLQLAWTTRTKMGIGIFIFAASITLITAIIAVTSQTLKAARANPVEALKYE